ncbi:type-F conjugative transfer system protein TraW [Massilia sp. YMA4]|uniref:Type-F conjugative transfer system protein TraW n=1 Tax=[Empedobacter] haloabium TaxID=592317 RepID=A0ABZ1UST5_9BURK|nr:type-F conjugative transfer system protein TraW [Massilia sp. YMA4]AXA91344.1 type-F conjugative transfer system protein TraW [Massilia sp. YMA4]
MTFTGTVLPPPGAQILIAALASAVITLPSAAASASTQPLGPTYPVIEQDLLVMIESRLKAKDATGEIARLFNEAGARARSSVNDPPPVPGLVACVQPRTFFFDPSVVLSQDVRDHAGRLLFARGTRKNPLDLVSMRRPLLFFDARDIRQRDIARLMLQQPIPPKVVLVGGSYVELMREWRIPVFYDQRGLLSRQLGLKQVPALVAQDGSRLRIEELKVVP